MTNKVSGDGEVVKRNLRHLRRPEETKQSLADILADMDVLDKSDYTPEEKSIIPSGESTAFGYDEWIQPGLASVLLGKDFDVNCRYKMVTQEDAITVLKIDDRIPENERPVYDEHGRIIRAHVMEYVLEEDEERFEKQELPKENSCVNLDLMDMRPKRFKPGFVAVFGTVMLILIAVWVGIMLFFIKVGGI